MRGLLVGRVPPEGPWELQGIELLSQNELYRQILMLLHLLPQDLLLPQVRFLSRSSAGPWALSLGLVITTSRGSDPVLQLPLVKILPPAPEGVYSLNGFGASLPTALPVFLLLLSGSAGPPHPVWAPGC